MARKSNKTSHVLNLLAGHEDKEKETQETQNTEAANITEDKPAASPQNISVIDKTEDDALAQLIQEQLTKELEAATGTPEADEAAETTTPEADEAIETTMAEATEQTATAPQQSTETDTVETPKQSVETETMETNDMPKAEAAPTPAPETAPVKKEPDFVTLNVMEQVVRDKIIYFMRQFEVCTCDRCVADTIALALNGLAPKYIVTTPAAADPLLSFYTNKFIPDITVEATKACMTIKENPRH